MEPSEPRPSAQQTAAQSLDEHDQRTNAVGAESALPALASSSGGWLQDPAGPLPRVFSPGQGMPRQFGVGSIMAVTVTYALVLSVASGFGASPVTMGGLFVLLVAVTAGQALLFGGKKPRMASITVGAALPGLWIVLEMIVSSLVTERVLAPGGYVSLILGLPVLCAVGAIFGYLAGVIVAGTFVILDRLARIYKRLRP